MADRRSLEPHVGGSSPPAPAMRQIKLLDPPALAAFVRRAKKLHASGLSWSEIARVLGVSRTCLQMRLKRQERSVA